MLAVLLAAAAVGIDNEEYSCPDEYPFPREWMERRYCKGDQWGTLTSANTLHVTTTAQFTREFLCQPATTVYSWCTAALTGNGVGSVVKCFDNTVDIVANVEASGGSIKLDDDMTFAKDVQTRDAGSTTMATIDCFPPAGTSPASGEAGDLDGATVGTIVVASLVGVALVGGAIAVHLEL